MEPRRIIIGAVSQQWPCWLPTQQEDLDLLRQSTWVSRFSPNTIDALLFRRYCSIPTPSLIMSNFSQGGQG